jgi:5-methylcytosine-specific restriction endonuclease McrA
MARKKLDKNIRDLVWKKYNGNRTKAKCFCCGIREIYYNDYHIGHNKPVSKGGSDNISNLRCVCANCNSGMGNRYTITEYKKKFMIKKKKSSTKKRAKKIVKNELFPKMNFKELIGF